MAHYTAPFFLLNHVEWSVYSLLFFLPKIKNKKVMRKKEMVYRAANKNAPVYLKTDHDFAAHTSELANVMSP